jgi:hypothetical protein
MIATSAGTALWAGVIVRNARDGFRRSPPTARRIAVRLGMFALFFGPGIVVLILAPWGSKTFGVLLLAYIVPCLLYILGLSAYEARRSRSRLRSNRRASDS